MKHSLLSRIFGNEGRDRVRLPERRTTDIRGVFASVAAALFLWSAAAEAQRSVFAQALLDFQAAIEGTFGDEGPRITASLDAMAASLAGLGDEAVSLGTADRPLLPLVAYAAGYELLARGKYTEAIAAFRAAAAGDPLLADPASGSASMARAAAALRRGAPKEARALLEHSPLLSSSSEAHRILGLAYWADAEDERSVEHLQAAIRRSPRDERSHLALAHVLGAAGRDADAERALRDMLALLPDSVLARWSLAACYERMNRIADARREYERAAAGAVSGRAPIYAAIGRLARQAGDTTAALEAFGRAVEANPADGVLRKSLAGVLLQHDRAGDAAAQLDAALRLDPEDAGALAALGQIHLDAGRYEEAVRALQRALRTVPASTEARYSLATALRRLGKLDEAERELRRVEQEQQRALDERRRIMSEEVAKEDAAWRARQGGAR